MNTVPSTMQLVLGITGYFITSDFNYCLLFPVSNVTDQAIPSVCVCVCVCVCVFVCVCVAIIENINK